MWHGDVGDSARKRILSDPPDLLLTTPESLEVMLVSPRVTHGEMFAGIRAVVVDEVHAFAGDDRGWHMLAVLERVARLAGRPLQRIGLSATVGNTAEVLNWLAGLKGRQNTVVGVPTSAPRPADVQVDYVGTLQNALIISRLHRARNDWHSRDSRSVEDWPADSAGSVSIPTSHTASISADERRAEEAFAVGNDCVIVPRARLNSVSTGDLSRVIQTRRRRRRPSCSDSGAPGDGRGALLTASSHYRPTRSSAH